MMEINKRARKKKKGPGRKLNNYDTRLNIEEVPDIFFDPQEEPEERMDTDVEVRISTTEDDKDNGKNSLF